MEAKRRALTIRLAIFATVAAGALLLGGGVAAASHVNCGNTITQDTTLDSDLIDCPGYGLVIAGDGVTLDLNGHVIDGQEGSGSFGVFDDGHDDVTVENGTIQQFTFGLVLGQSYSRPTGNVVRGITTRSIISSGIGLLSMDHVLMEDNTSQRYFLSSIRDSVIRRNQGGIALTGLSTGNLLEGNRGGMFVRDSQENVVTDNDLSAGLYLLDADTNQLVGNRSSLGTQNWFFERSDGNLIERNAFAAGERGGIVLFASADNHVVRNSLAGGRGVGILLHAGSRGNHVERNAISGFRESDPSYGNQEGASGAGIGVIARAQENLIERNRLTDNRDGIHVTGFDDFYSVVDNRLERNVVTANLRDGILVDPNSRGILVFHNQSDGNGDDGIDVAVPQVTLTANSADRNRDLGIAAVPGVADGGANRASFNGNPLQCLNVACK